MTDDEYSTTIDREQVSRARRSTSPIDFTKVRRVRVDDEGPTSYQARVDRERREMAQAANADREREGDTE
jgi:hypothetical protein